MTNDGSGATGHTSLATSTALLPGLEEWEMSCYSLDRQQNCPLLSLLLWGPQKHAKINSMLAKMDFIPDTEKVHTDSENTHRKTDLECYWPSRGGRSP